MGRDKFGAKGCLLYSIGTLCRELCKNGRTDRNAVWDGESGGTKEPRIDGGTDPHGVDRGNFEGEGHAQHDR